MSDTVLDSMLVKLTGDGSSYFNMMNKAQSVAYNTSRSIAGTVGGISKSITSLVSGMVTSTTAQIAAMTAAAAGVAGIGMMLRKGLTLAADAEKAQITFSTILHSEEQAAKLMSEIEKYAAATPLQTAGLQQAAKTMLQFGVAGDRIMPMLKALGNATGGDNERFQHMALAFGQMSAAGRLMGQDLLQMINAGFNPLQQISKTTGKSMAELKVQMEHGAISADMVTQAFYDASKAGGMFDGLMDKQSRTLGGLWSTLTDNIQIQLKRLSTFLVDKLDLKGLIKNTSDFIANSQKDIEAWATFFIDKGIWVYKEGKKWFEAIGKVVGPYIREGFLIAEFAFKNYTEFQAKQIAVTYYNVLKFVNEYIHFFKSTIPYALAYFGRNWQGTFNFLIDVATDNFQLLLSNFNVIWDEITRVLKEGGPLKTWKELQDKTLALPNRKIKYYTGEEFLPPEREIGKMEQQAKETADRLTEKIKDSYEQFKKDKDKAIWNPTKFKVDEAENAALNAGKVMGDNLAKGIQHGSAEMKSALVGSASYYDTLYEYMRGKTPLGMPGAVASTRRRQPTKQPSKIEEELNFVGPTQPTGFGVGQFAGVNPFDTFVGPRPEDNIAKTKRETQARLIAQNAKNEAGKPGAFGKSEEYLRTIAEIAKADAQKPTITIESANLGASK